MYPVSLMSTRPRHSAPVRPTPGSLMSILGLGVGRPVRGGVTTRSKPPAAPRSVPGAWVVVRSSVTPQQRRCSDAGEPSDPYSLDPPCPTRLMDNRGYPCDLRARPLTALGPEHLTCDITSPTRHQQNVDAWLAMRARIARTARTYDDADSCGPESSRWLVQLTWSCPRPLPRGIAGGTVALHRPDRVRFVSPGLNPLPSRSSVRLEPCCAFRREATERTRSFFHSVPPRCGGVAPCPPARAASAGTPSSYNALSMRP